MEPTGAGSAAAGLLRSPRPSLRAFWHRQRLLSSANAAAVVTAVLVEKAGNAVEFLLVR